MKKLYVIIALMLTTFLFTACSDSAANSSDNSEKNNEKASKEQYVLKLAEIHPDSHIIAQADYEFARLVEEKTNGNVKVEVYTNGKLGIETDIRKLITDGTIDFARTSTSVYTDVSEMSQALEIPYLFRDSDHLWRSVESYIIPALDNDLYKENTKLLACFDSGARNFYTNKKITTAKDFKGLKIRVYDSASTGPFISMLEANPVLLPFEDIYDAIKTGELNGAENNFTSYYTSNHYTVAKYVLKAEYKRIPDILVMNSKLYEELPIEYQTAITSAAAQASLFERENWTKFEKSIEKKLTSGGCEIITPSQELMNLFYENSKYIYLNSPKLVKRYYYEINSIH